MTSIGQTNEGSIYRGDSLKPLTWDEFLNEIPKGAVIFVGEQHGYAKLQQGQLSLLKGLRNLGHKVHVGMEFLEHSKQPIVDQYRQGLITEQSFLQLVEWGGFDFSLYRDQILFPDASKGESTFAINSPKWLPTKVAREGLSSLLPEEIQRLPPDFALGRDSYRARFESLMAGHVATKEAMQRYFEAQSVWDETMAWKLSEAYITPNDTMVVIVGQFHIEFGGGLPFQYQRRFQDRPVIILEEFLFYDDETIPWQDLAPTADGPRAHYLLLAIEKS
jgi:uncharacterized iron-regulated protein